MLSDNIKKEAAPKKKQDIKMLAIAAVAVLLMLGVLFWLFSSSSDEQKVQVSINKTETQTEKVLPKPPALNEQAIAIMNDANVANSVVGESPFETNTENQAVDITESIEGNSATAFNQEVIDKLASQNEQNQHRAEPTAANVKSINSAMSNSYDDMKDYLNDIKRDIKLTSNSFEYSNKIYRKGDFLNSFEIVDISNVFIRFSNGEWEYTLRFLGDR